jgi:hypothetical protein
MAWWWEEKEERSARPRGDGDGTDVCRGVVFFAALQWWRMSERGERETDLTLLSCSTGKCYAHMMVSEQR